jgi:hypothetical protein
MLLWILLATFLVLAAIAFIRTCFVDSSLSIVYTFMAGIMLLLGYMMIVIAVEPTNSDLTTGDRVTLRALNVGDSTGGSFFLGSGSVNGEKSLDYIVQDEDNGDTWSEVKSVDADYSRVYEDTETEPYMLVREKDLTNYGVWPWPSITVERYDFHIPKGSVSSDITVDLK